jgi:hypothetical protein
MVVESLGEALKGIEFSVGIGGRYSRWISTYVAVVDLKFESVAAFQAAFGLNAAKFAADVPNYTTVQGELQIRRFCKFQ